MFTKNCDFEIVFKMRFLLNNRELRHRLSNQYQACIRNFSSSEEKAVFIEDYNQEVRIQEICNKSRMKHEHRNILFGKKPYSEPLTEVHSTVGYNRKLYGRYGNASGVNLGIMWPTKTEINKQKEYESIAYPDSINEMVNKAKSEIEEKEKERQMIQEKIINNMAKLDMWKKQLRDTIAKKEADALAAKEKKEKLVEEVRRHFGFTVDPRDERFKEMLALKEKEIKKKEKQARMEEREKKAIERMLETSKTQSE